MSRRLSMSVGLLLVASVLCVSGPAQDATKDQRQRTPVVVIPDRRVSMSELVDIIRNDEPEEHQGAIPGAIATYFGLTTNNNKLPVTRRWAGEDAHGISNSMFFAVSDTSKDDIVIVLMTPDDLKTGRKMLMAQDGDAVRDVLVVHTEIMNATSAHK